MTPRYALDLDPICIRLLRRAEDEWAELGTAPTDAADLQKRLSALLDMAEDGARPVEAEIVLPGSQILYTTLAAPAEDTDPAAWIGAGLDGLTPYALADIAFDWEVEGDSAQVAAIARETLEEADRFARALGVRPAGFAAWPEAPDFPRPATFPLDGGAALFVSRRPAADQKTAAATTAEPDTAPEPALPDPAAAEASLAPALDSEGTVLDDEAARMEVAHAGSPPHDDTTGAGDTPPWRRPGVMAAGLAAAAVLAGGVFWALSGGPPTDTAPPPETAAAPPPSREIPAQPSEELREPRIETAAAPRAAAGPGPVTASVPGRPPPPPDAVDPDFRIAAIDPATPSLDAVALPGLTTATAAAPRAAPAPSPVTPETPDEPIAATDVPEVPDAAPDLSPVIDAVPVVPPPAVLPQETPPGEVDIVQPDPADALPVTDFGALQPTELAAALPDTRPRGRPGNLVEQNERARFGGRTRAEMAELGPRARPASPQEEAGDLPPTAQAVASAPIPRDRPDNFDTVVAEARARAAQPPPAAAASTSAGAVAAANDAASPAAVPSPPRSAAPSIPTRAEVAREATIENAMQLSRLNLIGVYGGDADRRALLRLPSGRIVKVQVGDRVDGGRVAAIGASDLRYSKGGRDITLRIPSG